MKNNILLLILCWTCFYPGLSQGKTFPPTVERPVRQAIQIQKQLQIKQDKWQREKQRLLGLYKSLSQEVELLEYQNRDLEKEKKALQQNITSLRIEIKRAEEISQGIMPFLMEVYNSLCKFVKIDLPFLREEREKRLYRLKEILTDPSVSIAEKYRKTMEALFVEVKYGRSVGVYQDRVKIGGEEIVGNIFRLGRIALFFESPDRDVYAIFDPSLQRWRRLSPSIARDIATAIEIAEKRRPSSLLMLPIGKMEGNDEDNN